MNDIRKLPKWAQQHIDLLEKNLEYTKAQFIEHTKAGIDSYPRVTLKEKITAGDDERVSISPNTRIKFEFSENEYIDVFVSKSKPFVLNVHAYGDLMIAPGVSNAVELVLVDSYGMRKKEKSSK